MTIQDMLDMPIGEYRHDEYESNGTVVVGMTTIRVPGGWVFRWPKDSAVFVPEPMGYEYQKHMQAWADVIIKQIQDKQAELAELMQKWLTDATSHANGTIDDRIKAFDDFLAAAAKHFGKDWPMVKPVTDGVQ